MKSKKYQQLTETALSLFLKHGFKRISIEEICATAGVSKMTFYKYFDNKIDLLKVLLRQMSDKQMEKYNNIMHEDTPYSARVERIIRMKQDQAAFMGQELFNDLYKNAPEEITEFLHELGNEVFTTVRNDFIKAQKEGHIRQDLNPDFIVYFMNHMIDMVSDPRLLKMYDSSKNLIHELTRFFFYGILTQRENAAS